MELTDRNEILRQMRDSRTDCPYEGQQAGAWKAAHDCCISIVESVAAIEAEPVRRGYWKVHITSCRMYFECSECKKLFSNPLWMFDNDNKQLRDFMEEDNAYCRGCGAKMDGKEDA